MGELLRRYWHPVAASCELKPGVVLPVRLLCEDLALFRTSSGKLGLIDQRCTHRGTSLLLGRVDDDGIACPYHGWRFGTDGRCLQMPAERSGEQKLQRGDTRAALVSELGGMIFAYLGPDPAPLLPRYDLYVWDDVLRDVGRALIPCNWLQIMENSVDPTHVEWLHGQHLAGVRADKGLSTPSHYSRRHRRIGFDRFEHGVIKRRVLEGGSEDGDDWQVGHPLIFPCMLRVGAMGQHRFQIRVPVDDTHTLHWWYSCYRFESAPPKQEQVPLYEVPWQDAEGQFIVDFVDGGDIMTWVSQGPIADRTRERLVASDRGILLYRQMLAEQLSLVEQGCDPMGVIRDPALNQQINFAQENDKFGGGADFLRQALELSHARHSPLKAQLLALLGFVNDSTEGSEASCAS